MVLFFYIAGQFLKDNDNISIFDASVSLTLLFLILLLLAFVITVIIKIWSPRDVSQVTAIRPIENNLTPTYIGLFVIALSINTLNFGASLVILLLLFIWWTLFEKMSYFNPLWLILGWHFYEITCSTGSTVFLVTKRKDYKQPSTICLLYTSPSPRDCS